LISREKLLFSRDQVFFSREKLLFSRDQVFFSREKLLFSRDWLMLFIAYKLRGLTATWKYKAIYLYDNQQAGNWSTVVIVTVVGNV